jgi:hypothetical protein
MRNADASSPEPLRRPVSLPAAAPRAQAQRASVAPEAKRETAVDSTACAESCRAALA